MQRSHDDYIGALILFCIWTLQFGRAPSRARESVGVSTFSASCRGRRMSLLKKRSQRKLQLPKKPRTKTQAKHFKYHHFFCQTLETGAGNCSRSSGGGQRPQGREKGGQRLQGAADILKPCSQTCKTRSPEDFESKNVFGLQCFLSM